MRNTLFTATMLSTLTIATAAFAGGGGDEGGGHPPPTGGSTTTQQGQVQLQGQQQSLTNTNKIKVAPVITTVVNNNVAAPAATTPAVRPAVAARAATAPAATRPAVAARAPARAAAPAQTVYYNQSQPRQAPGIAAASFEGGNLCALSASGGFTTSLIGVVFGKSYESRPCERRMLAALLGNMGHPDAGTALLCDTDSEVRYAMIHAGTPCPADRPVLYTYVPGGPAPAWCVSMPTLAAQHPEACAPAGIPPGITRRQ